MDNKKSLIIGGIVIGALLAVFFISGFLISGHVISSNNISNSENNSEIANQAAKNIMNKLGKTTFSYPFAYNLSKVSLNKVNDSSFHNLTISFTIEANPFDNGIYRVPGNKSKVNRQISLFIDGKGNYFFSSPPQKVGNIKTTKKTAMPR